VNEITVRPASIAHCVTAFFGLIGCVVLIGCSSGMAHVTGKVTLDGQTLSGGGNRRVTVQFQPASGSGASSIAVANENGHYTLATGSTPGVPPGDYVVSVLASELVEAKDPTGVSGSRTLIDAKYKSAKTSGIKFSVQSGQNQCDIALVSAPKTAKTGS
jgi:hypothetical protein